VKVAEEAVVHDRPRPTLTVGVSASFAPRTFYGRFPFVTDWVDLLPPYNEHLTVDVGGLRYVGDRSSRVGRGDGLLCAAWSISHLLHLEFHLTHLYGFGAADAIAQTLALTVIALVPVIPILLMRQPPTQTHARWHGARRSTVVLFEDVR
jgi:hypothetical protein